LTRGILGKRWLGFWGEYGGKGKYLLVLGRIIAGWTRRFGKIGGSRVSISVSGSGHRFF